MALLLRFSKIKSWKALVIRVGEQNLGNKRQGRGALLLIQLATLQIFEEAKSLSAKFLVALRESKHNWRSSLYSGCLQRGNGQCRARVRHVLILLLILK